MFWAIFIFIYFHIFHFFQFLGRRHEALAFKLWKKSVLNCVLTPPHCGRGPELLKSSGIIHSRALCVELWPIDCSKRILAPMSYMSLWELHKLLGITSGDFWPKYAISCESKVACKFSKKKTWKALNRVLTLPDYSSPRMHQ